MTCREREQVVEWGRDRYSVDDVTLSVLGHWLGVAMGWELGWGVPVDTSRARVRPNLREIRDIQRYQRYKPQDARPLT